MRREVFQVLGQRQAGHLGRPRGQLLLVVEQLRQIAVITAIVASLAQLAEHGLQGGEDLVLAPGGAGQCVGQGRTGRGRRAVGQAELRRLDRRGQARAQRRQVLVLQLLAVGHEQPQTALEVGLVHAVVRQVGQHGQELHGHAVRAAGQAAADVPLVELGGLEVIDLELGQTAGLAGATLEGPHLLPAGALKAQQAEQLGQQ